MDGITENKSKKQNRVLHVRTGISSERVHIEGSLVCELKLSTHSINYYCKCNKDKSSIFKRYKSLKYHVT